LCGNQEVLVDFDTRDAVDRKRSGELDGSGTVVIGDNGFLYSIFAIQNDLNEIVSIISMLSATAGRVKILLTEIHRRRRSKHKTPSPSSKQ
jgi:hypothetical protein